MLTISLNTIRVRGPHGLYPEEAIRGNDFEVDIEVRLPARIGDNWPLVDYSRISELVHDVMRGKTVPLLEMLVQDIYSRIREEWPILSHIKVIVRKMNPPMHGNVNYAQVCYEG